MSSIKQKFDEFDHKWRATFSSGLNNPLIRKSAIKHAYWMDHEVLRQFYHNDYEIHKNVFRSNQPSPERVKKWSARGIKTIINFRGMTNQAAYYLEKEACDACGVHLINYQLFATRLPSKEVLLDLEKVFEKIEYPFLMHCKSGSDRAGLGSALYYLYMLNAPIEIAQKQLSFKYLHIGGWTAGILDYMLMQYRLAYEVDGVLFRDWLVSNYNIEELTYGFNTFRKKNHLLKVPR